MGPRIADIDITVLAGGLGTRLQKVLPDTPKILAPQRGQPFLEHLLRWLSSQGARRVLLALGYRAEGVLAYLESRSFTSLRVETIVEPEPLGTGGAVAFARAHLNSDPVMVVNGDTIVDADLNAFLASHQASGAEASILCAEVKNAGRYGRVEIDAASRVRRFEEKDPGSTGTHWINAGFYLFRRTVLDRIASLRKGSLEHDILEKMPPGSLHAFRTRGRFLDIGTPETLAVAPEVLPP